MVEVWSIFWLVYKQAIQYSTRAPEAIGVPRYRSSYPLEKLVLEALMPSHWCRRWGCRGCKRTRKSFDLVKIRVKSVEFWEKSLKTFKKSWKSKVAPNLLWKKLEPRIARRVFLVVTFLELFGQVWENSGKNPSHPQKFAYSYTYVPSIDKFNRNDFQRSNFKLAEKKFDRISLHVDATFNQNLATNFKLQEDYIVDRCLTTDESSWPAILFRCPALWP